MSKSRNYKNNFYPHSHTTSFYLNRFLRIQLALQKTKPTFEELQYNTCSGGPKVKAIQKVSCAL